jgi:hypothetical protein
VDVEFEEVEEGVRDEFYGAVLLGLDAVVELEGFACFVAGGEGRPFYFVVVVLDVLACLTEQPLEVTLSRGQQGRAYKFRCIHSTRIGAP